MKPGPVPRWARSVAAVGALALMAVLALHYGSRRLTPSPPPPRATRTISLPPVSSTIAVPITARLSTLARVLDRELPVELWQIDMPHATCLAPAHIRLLGKRLAVSPRLACHIVGSVRRGAIALHGRGRDIIADVPVFARVEAQHVAGLVSTHAEGQAIAHARIRLSIAPDWRAGGSIALAYDWETPPALVLLGQRITFTEKADDHLRPVIASLEHSLPTKLADFDLRQRIGSIWRAGFAVVQLNDDHPPVWMRVVPQRLSYGGYSIEGQRLHLSLGLVAQVQAMVGTRPADPPPTPLPDMGPPPPRPDRLHLIVPVRADYAELVPVVTRALAKRSTRPFDLPGIGPVEARFSAITIYGASGGRIAVGANIAASPLHGGLAPTRGRIWLAGVPDNDEGSQIVRFHDLTVAGGADTVGGRLLVAIANSPGFAEAIAGALTQNFTSDYADLERKIRRAIADRAQGDLHIDARLESARNGRLAAYADGLAMPVEMTGQASVTFTGERSEKAGTSEESGHS